MRSRVSCRAGLRWSPRSTRDTVEASTPARRATSLRTAVLGWSGWRIGNREPSEWTPMSGRQLLTAPASYTTIQYPNDWEARGKGERRDAGSATGEDEAGGGRNAGERPAGRLAGDPRAAGRRGRRPRRLRLGRARPAA